MNVATREQGYFLLTAVLLIVVVSVLSVAAVHRLASGSLISREQLAAEQALYLAESGREEAIFSLLQPNLSGRLACSALDGSSESLAAGQFALQASNYYIVSGVQLTSPVGLSDNQIQVNNASALAPSGRVLLDREAIDYTAIAGNILMVVKRGADHTTVSVHSASTPVTQTQCRIFSAGAVPASNADPQREISLGVQLQEGWSVGLLNSNAFSIWRWYGPLANQWQDESFNPGGSAKADLQAVAMAANATVIAVGNATGNNFTLRHWSPATNNWLAGAITKPSNKYIRNLLGVSVVSSHEAWAVGQRSDHTGSERQYTILHYNGSNWCLLGPGGDNCSTVNIPVGHNSNRHLFAVSVIDSNGNGQGNFGFAVGQSGRILRFNGSQWSNDTPAGSSANLNAVDVISANEAWAVNSNGDIWRWSGGSWTVFASPTNEVLRSISMLDQSGNGFADTGWAVGNNGVALHYANGAWQAANIAWQAANIASDIPGTPNMFAVAILSANDAWAVGAGGRRVHWNGQQWQLITSSGVGLRGLAMLGAHVNPQAAWQQVVG